MGLFDTFRKGLQKTATAITRGIAGLFTAVHKWEPEDFRKLEDALIEADFGPESARKITDGIRDRYSRGLISGADDLNAAAREDLVGMLAPGLRELKIQDSGPTVILLVGVNGSGKTTTAGKLAWIMSTRGKRVMLGACDTFRAAAVEQLKLWADRTGSEIIASKQGADPAAVAFDAVSAALARHAHFLILDTAGRQQNQKNLMDELAKIRRTVSKLLPGAPHETLLTIDASIGLNTLSQAREFAETAGVTGLILTKLDGTGKGGAAVRVQTEFKLPILYAGMGEQPEDLQKFDPEKYAAGIFPPPVERKE